IISNGRLILGLGLGYREEEFRGFGVPADRMGEVMDEALEIVLRAWTEAEFTFEGRHFRLSNVRMTPKPLQRPRPATWVGRTGKAGARRVARFGLEGFCG